MSTAFRPPGWSSPSVSYVIVPAAGTPSGGAAGRPSLQPRGRRPSWADAGGSRVVAGTAAGPLPVERGATRTTLPAGYRYLRRRVPLGSGRAAFDAASTLVSNWEMHRRAGLGPVADAPAARVGRTVVMCAGLPRRAGVLAACRVVWVLEEPDRRGFAYGTLPAHPEIGEEAFVVEREADDSVWLAVTAFSRPNGLRPTLTGPVGRAIQNIITNRYVRAIRDG